jgi:hypothetical protein
MAESTISPSYLKSHQCDAGWYVAVQLRTGGVSEQRIKELPERVDKAAARHFARLRYCSVDTRPRKSASKLRDQDETPRRRSTPVRAGRQCATLASGRWSETSWNLPIALCL